MKKKLIKWNKLAIVSCDDIFIYQTIIKHVFYEYWLKKKTTKY